MVLLKSLKETKKGLVAKTENGKEFPVSAKPQPGIAHLDERPGKTQTEKMENLKREMRQIESSCYLISGSPMEIHGGEGQYVLYDIFKRK